MKTGDAYVYANNLLQEFQDQLNANLLSWTDFKKDLDKQFKDPELERKARSHLFTLIQGKKTAEEFFLGFDAYRVKGKLSEDHFDHILTDRLDEALNNDLVVQIHAAYETNRQNTEQMNANMRDIVQKMRLKDDTKGLEDFEDLPEQPSYKDYRELALKLGPLMRKNNRFQSRFSQQTFSTPRLSTFSSSTKPAATSTSKANDNTLPPQPGDTPMEIGQRKITCFNCGKQGHIARNCPDPKKPRYFPKKQDLRQMVDSGDLSIEEIKAYLKEKEGNGPPTYNPTTRNPPRSQTLYEPKDDTTTHAPSTSSPRQDFQ
jgi:hypothetical protein